MASLKDALATVEAQLVKVVNESFPSIRRVYVHTVPTPPESYPCVIIARESRDRIPEYENSDVDDEFWRVRYTIVVLLAPVVTDDVQTKLDVIDDIEQAYAVQRRPTPAGLSGASGIIDLVTGVVDYGNYQYRGPQGEVLAELAGGQFNLTVDIEYQRSA